MKRGETIKIQQNITIIFCCFNLHVQFNYTVSENAAFKSLYLLAEAGLHWGIFKTCVRG